MDTDGTPGTRKLLYRPEEAAALISVGKTTFYELIKRGLVHTVEVPGVKGCRVTDEELVRFVAGLREDSGHGTDGFEDTDGGEAVTP